MATKDSDRKRKGAAAFGRGDYATALKEFTPLAEQGDANAQTMLGWMYDNGEGVAQDYATAVKWYRLAAEQGDVMAQFILSEMRSDRDAWKQQATALLAGPEGRRRRGWPW